MPGPISNIYSNIYAQTYKMETKREAGARLAQQQKAREKRRRNRNAFVAVKPTGPARIWESPNPTGTDKSVRAGWLRSHPTRSEEIIWNELRQFGPSMQFRPSVLLYGYIADFYCERLGIVVEVDGRFHNRENDRKRDSHLIARGIKTLRFPSSMAFTGLDRVISTVRAYAESQVTALVAAASRGASKDGTQDDKRKRPAGFETVNNGSMSGSAKPVA